MNKIETINIRKHKEIYMPIWRAHTAICFKMIFSTPSAIIFNDLRSYIEHRYIKEMIKDVPQWRYY
jgi:hypothetical protein